MGDRGTRRQRREQIEGEARLEEFKTVVVELAHRKEQLRVRLEDVDRCRRIVVERSGALESVYKNAKNQGCWKPVSAQTAEALLVDAATATGMPWPLPAEEPEEWVEKELLRKAS